jgi:hypothetical protein
MVVLFVLSSHPWFLDAEQSVWQLFKMFFHAFLMPEMRMRGNWGNHSTAVAAGEGSIRKLTEHLLSMCMPLADWGTFVTTCIP